jgi:hypothetical protein
VSKSIDRDGNDSKTTSGYKIINISKFAQFMIIAGILISLIVQKDWSLQGLFCFS